MATWDHEVLLQFRKLTEEILSMYDVVNETWQKLYLAKVESQEFATKGNIQLKPIPQVLNGFTEEQRTRLMRELQYRAWAEGGDTPFCKYWREVLEGDMTIMSNRYTLEEAKCVFNLITGVVFKLHYHPNCANITDIITPRKTFSQVTFRDGEEAPSAMNGEDTDSVSRKGADSEGEGGDTFLTQPQDEDDLPTNGLESVAKGSCTASLEPAKIGTPQASLGSVRSGMTHNSRASTAC